MLSHELPANHPLQPAEAVPASATNPEPFVPPEAHEPLSIKKYPFFCPKKFEEGQALTAELAEVLNSALLDRVKASFTRHVEKAEELGNLPEALPQLQKMFWDSALDYTFGKRRRQAATPLDPVEHEARKIAKAQVLAVLSRNKIDHRSLAEGVLDRNITLVLSKRPDIWDEARSRVESARLIAEQLMQDDDLDFLNP